MPAPTVGASQKLEKLVSSFFVPWGQWSPTFLAPGTGFVEDSFSTDCGVGSGFRMIQAHYIYCALDSYYYYIAIYDEIIIQLTIMQNPWEPWACFLQLLDGPIWGFWYESASNCFIMVSVQSNFSANDTLYLKPLASPSISTLALPHIIRH